ncbi:fibrinogen-like protein 1 [Pyxicephalus adspersus]|uniref:fibrinogen-like protein 1 n=1 Tax=Pyxicephalus adspersus TaxID=30357 RepID=UPI003B59DA5B
MALLSMLPVVLALSLPYFVLSAPRLSDLEICHIDNAKLRHRIQILENMLDSKRGGLKEINARRVGRSGDAELPIGYREIKLGQMSWGLWLGSAMGSSLCTSRRRATNLLGFNMFIALYCSSVFEGGKKENGYYRIQPKPLTEPITVFCDMSDGGGWTVIQRRSNGKVSFNRNWQEYKEGFGLFKHRNDEYWLGNDHIYNLLESREMTLQIDLMDWQGKTRHAIYDSFRITNEEDNYKLWLGYYSGNAGDALAGGNNFENQWSASLRGMPFSTPDKDNDRFLKGSCATENKCGWWFNRCHVANLNGIYYKKGNYTGTYDNGIVWSTWHGLWYSLKFTAMKIRSPSFLNAGSGDGLNG